MSLPLAADNWTGGRHKLNAACHELATYIICYPEQLRQYQDMRQEVSIDGSYDDEPLRILVF